MPTPKQILLICSLLLSFIGISQDYNYIHYTNKDGLAGNTVYGVTQDKDGYMFFATENGLSRFDGKEWVTFTVKDGLPDNEILVLYGDSKGRIWMSCFSKQICYYYKGKIYNANNSELLKQVKLNKIAVKFIEILGDGVYMSTGSSIYLISNNDSIILVATSKKPFWGTDLIPDYTKKLFIIVDDSFFTIRNNSLIFEKFDSTRFTHNMVSLNYDSKKPKTAFFKDKLVTVETNILQPTFINTNNGTYRIDTVKKELAEHFLKGIKTGHTFEDKENNIWFATLGQGVYKLPSRYVKTYTVPSAQNSTNNEIFSIGEQLNEIIAGASFGKILKSTLAKKIVLDFQSHIKFSANNNNIINRATSILNISKNTSIIGFDSYLLKLENQQRQFNYFMEPVKSVERIDENNVVVSSSQGCFKIKIKELVVTDTLFAERTTYSNYSNHHYYIGTINGLYLVDENKKQTFLGNIHPALKRRITCIKNSDDGRIFIGTADAGIVVLKDKKVVNVLNDINGLSNNIVKTIHINDKILWAGTYKGINKIDLSTNKVIVKYTTGDGLPSDIINAIYVDIDSTVWVGSPEGLTSFKEKEIASTSICNLVMQKIIVSNNNLNIDSNNFSLRYQDNNIQFQFVGISFRSGDEITYNYRLKGLTEDWRTTKERILDFPSLPYDKNYTLEIFATNKFGVISKTINFNFYVATPFWKTNWFIALVYIIGFAIMFGFIYWRYKRLQARNYERANFKVQLANMEQQALQAQMNPHFIFNCLNSIQQFILLKETEKANKYLILFSRLIRNTLDNSDKKTITLADEKVYLEQYLELEQMRFGDKFSYTINIESSIDIDEIMIPAMLLQPFVENSLRHGIRQLKDRNGNINIDFMQRNDYLCCHIKDDGIGREAAEKLKTNMHIEYQSKGVNLTNKRVELLNTNLKNKISIEMIDCKDETGIATGTEVIVMIPTNIQ